MRYQLIVCGIATSFLALAGGEPCAMAEDLTSTLTCQDVGGGGPEALGDREGHSVSVGQVSCRVDGGPMSGGVLTGTDIWEWDGPNAVSLVNNGIVRKDGATAVYQNTEAKLALTITDGKVTGWVASGKGHYQMATGSASVLMGKSCSYIAKPTGPHEFTADTKCE
jgi:hypothetical protein